MFCCIMIFTLHITMHGYVLKLLESHEFAQPLNVVDFVRNLCMCVCLPQGF